MWFLLEEFTSQHAGINVKVTDACFQGPNIINGWEGGVMTEPDVKIARVQI